ATIYEWDAHRFCYFPVATTGLAASQSPEPIRHGLIGHVASRLKPLLLTEILNPEQVRKETGEVFDASTLAENLEATYSLPKSALILPVMNPAQNERNKPVALLKLVNKRPFLGKTSVYFDHDDIT